VDPDNQQQMEQLQLRIHKIIMFSIEWEAARDIGLAMAYDTASK